MSRSSTRRLTASFSTSSTRTCEFMKRSGYDSECELCRVSDALLMDLSRHAVDEAKL